MLKGGLVGFGAVAENAHVPAFAQAQGLSLVAVADPVRKSATLRSYPTFDAMVENERLDFVVICTPPSTHTALARKALALGLKVLCEKPLLEPVDGVSVVHNWAYAPIWRKAFELARKPRRVEIEVRRTRPSVSALPGDWRKDPKVSGGGILVDHGWHALYLVHRLLGPVELLSAKLEPAGGVDETATLELQGARIFLTWGAQERSNYARIDDIELRDDHILADGRRYDFPEKLSQGSAHPDWNSAMLPDILAEFEGRSTRTNDEAKFCASVINRCYGGVSV